MSAIQPKQSTEEILAVNTCRNVSVRGIVLAVAVSVGTVALLALFHQGLFASIPRESAALVSYITGGFSVLALCAFTALCLRSCSQKNSPNVHSKEAGETPLAQQSSLSGGDKDLRLTDTGEVPPSPLGSFSDEDFCLKDEERAILPQVNHVPLGRGYVLYTGSYPTARSSQQTEAMQNALRDPRGTLKIDKFVDLILEEEHNTLPSYTRAGDERIRSIQMRDESADIDSTALINEIDSLIRLIEKGHRLYIHCRGGNGRTSLVTTLIYVRMNHCDWETALKHVLTHYFTRESPLYPYLPESPQQLRKLQELAPGSRDDRLTFDAWQEECYKLADRSHAAENFFARGKFPHVELDVFCQGFMLWKQRQSGNAEDPS